MYLTILLQTESFEHLQQSISSLKEQSHANTEIFVLAAAPFSQHVCESLASEQNVVFMTGGDCLASLYKRAIQQSRGKFIVSLREEDLLAPNCLEILCHCLESKPNEPFVWAAHTDTSPEIESLSPATAATPEQAGIIELLAFGPPRCVMWKNELSHLINFHKDLEAEEAIFSFLLKVSETQQGLFYPAELLAVRADAMGMIRENTQQKYYKRLELHEKYLKKMLNGALPVFLPHQSLSTQLKKLGVMIANLDEGNPPTRYALETLSFQCIIAVWQANDISLAKELCISLLPVISNSGCIGLTLRRLILDSVAPGTKGQKSEGAPLVSVVTPLYNQGEYLLEAINSVLNQSYAHWEMIIVNDGSTDDSLSVAQKLLTDINDPRIKLLSHSNHGKGYTRNRGVKEAKGKYICVLDSDDEIAPDYLCTSVNMLESMPDKGWVTPKTLVFGADHHIAWSWIEDSEPGVSQCVSPCSAVYRRSLWEELGGYIENMIDREDWEFWIRAWEAGWCSTNSTEEILFVYRHAFSRFGTAPQINLSSKLEVIELHPWWFKSLTEEEVINECMQYGVGRFREEFMNMDYINIAKQLYNDKESLQRYMGWLKHHSAKLHQSSTANSETSKLCMALHYLSEGEREEFESYFAQIERGQLESWQDELLACVQPLILKICTS